MSALRERERASLPCLAVAGALVLSACGRPRGGPDVLLVVIDTLRADHVGCYGYPRDTTPNVDGLARTARRYEIALAPAPWTGSSVASIFTGLHPSSHGLLTNAAPLGEEALASDFLAPRAVTLAERFSKAGYRTAAVVSNPWLKSRYGYAQGFDRFEELPSKAAAGPVTSAAIERIEEFRRAENEAPYFLYVHYMDAHGPYDPDPPFDSMFRSPEARLLSDKEWAAVEPYLREGEDRDLNAYIDRYDGGIRQCDEQIGRLLLALGPRIASTVVVVTADHGEEFFEHGRAGHGYTLFEEMIRVPLVIKAPGAPPSVVAWPEFASLVDLAPTIAALAGLKADPDDFEGRDLSSGSPPPPESWSENHTKGSRLHGARRRDSKILYSENDDELVAWYELVLDPRESKSILQFSPPALAERERNRFREHIARCRERREKFTRGFAPPDRPADPADVADLERIGYVK